MNPTNLLPHQRFLEERALPPIFGPDGFNPARIDWYTKLTMDSELIHGGEAIIPEFIAAMICESKLDNLILGNNAQNGSDNPWLGIGWCQLDTGHHVEDLDALHNLRSDPLASLEYIATTPDLVTHGDGATHFNKKRWNAWWDRNTNQIALDKIDPVGQWSPLSAALDAWERNDPKLVTLTPGA